MERVRKESGLEFELPLAWAARKRWMTEIPRFLIEIAAKRRFVLLD